MPDLHIVVCVKIVPKPEEVRVDPETLRLDRSDARSEINPPDMNAMEVALRLKDRHGARVSILSMGPPFFTPLLRVALAMGADHIHLLSDRAFAGADTLATTYTLAQAIEKLGDVDLVICGEESSDGATGQAPAGLAAWLDWPQITMVNEATLSLDEASATVRGRRELEGGHEVLAAPLPAVLSVQTAANEPRFMDFELKPWAFAEGRTTVWDQDALAADPAYLGIDGSPTWVSGLTEAPTRARKRQMLAGDVDEMVMQLSALLARWEL